PPALHTLSLHDALPICPLQPRIVPGKQDRLAFAPDGADRPLAGFERAQAQIAVDLEALATLRARLVGNLEKGRARLGDVRRPQGDRKSTRLNSSHVKIS